MRGFRAVLAFSVALACATSARAQDVADFYRGKTVSLILSSAPGGGYDTMSRAVARFLPRHIPGNPQVIVRNMPGAGGIVATNHIAKVAPRDGLTIAGLQNNTPFEPLFGTKEADYDPTRMIWLGTPSRETATLFAWHATPFASLDDVRRKEMTVGASGANSTPSFYARLLNEVLGLKLKVVAGYPGQNEAYIAMERGELDGYGMTFWSSLVSTKPHWVKDRKIRVLLQYGSEIEPELAGVPFGSDLITKENDRLLFEAACGPIAAGRPYAAPPEVPRERAAALRAAMMATWRDPDFLAEAARLQIPVAGSKSGEELQETISRIYRTPPDIVARLRAISQNF